MMEIKYVLLLEECDAYRSYCNILEAPLYLWVSYLVNLSEVALYLFKSTSWFWIEYFSHTYYCFQTGAEQAVGVYWLSIFICTYKLSGI